MNIQKSGYSSIEQVRQKLSVGQSAKTAGSNGLESITTQNFGEILQQKNELRFSKHASERLEERNICISETQKARLEGAAEMAKDKGMRESLVMVDNLAFIVNVKSSTVITAVNDVKQGVFTNIDGAIVN